MCSATKITHEMNNFGNVIMSNKIIINIIIFSVANIDLTNKPIK